MERRQRRRSEQARQRHTTESGNILGERPTQTTAPASNRAERRPGRKREREEQQQQRQQIPNLVDPTPDSQRPVNRSRLSFVASIIFLLYTLPRLLSLADERSTDTEHIAPSRACLEAAGTLIASVLRSPPPLWTPWPHVYELTLSRIVYAIDPSFDSHTTRMTSARPTATIRIRPSVPGARSIVAS
jgi:hypothetical protein